MAPVSLDAVPHTAFRLEPQTSSMAKRGSARLIGELLSGNEASDLCAMRDQTTTRVRKKAGVIDTDGMAAAGSAIGQRVIEACAKGRQAVWAQFVDTPFPFVVHADTADGSNLDDVVVILPLDSTPQPAASTVFFRQHWTGRSANFVRGTPDYPGTVNETVTDYSRVERLSGEPFPEQIREQLLSHIRPEWLDGLSIEAALPWTVGSAILFPCTQLHASATMPHGARKRSLIMRLR